jgi:hypothetical protein
MPPSPTSVAAGCSTSAVGYGHELARMRELGAEAHDIVGVDLMRDRIEQARLASPGIEFRVTKRDATPLLVSPRLIWC